MISALALIGAIVLSEIHASDDQFTVRLHMPMHLMEEGRTVHILKRISVSHYAPHIQTSSIIPEHNWPNLFWSKELFGHYCWRGFCVGSDQVAPWFLRGQPKFDVSRQGEGQHRSRRSKAYISRRCSAAIGEARESGEHVISSNVLIVSSAKQYGYIWPVLHFTKDLLPVCYFSVCLDGLDGLDYFFGVYGQGRCNALHRNCRAASGSNGKFKITGLGFGSLPQAPSREPQADSRYGENQRESRNGIAERMVQPVPERRYYRAGVALFYAAIGLILGSLGVALVAEKGLYAKLAAALCVLAGILAGEAAMVWFQ